MKRILLSFVILLSAALSMAQMPILPGILNAQSAGGAAPVSSITFTGSCAAATTNCTLGASNAGDLQIAFTYRSASTTPPTLITGWTSVTTGATAASGVTGSYRVQCRVSNTLASGTATNASAIEVHSYSGTDADVTADCPTTGLGNSSTNNAKTSTTADYPALSLFDGSGLSYVVGFAGNSAGGLCTPSGLTNRNGAGTGPAVIGGDTNAGVSSWADTTCSVTSGTWMTYMQEILPHSTGTSSFTLVQHPSNFTCTTASCAVTTSAVTAGNTIVVWSAIHYSGAGGAATRLTLDAVTDNGTGESWKHCPNSAVNNANGSPDYYALDCWYALSAVGGETTITPAWTATGMTTPTYQTDAWVREYHPASTPVYYDSGNAKESDTNCTACIGPLGLLTSASDLISQAAIVPTIHTLSAISPPYTTLDQDSAGNDLEAGAADGVRSTYRVPQWTQSITGNPNWYGFVAFSNNASPVTTANIFSDFSACSNGSAPTNACISNSTFSGWIMTPDVSGIGAGMTACNTGPSSLLPIPIRSNGQSFTGTSALDLCGVTTTSGSNINNIDLGMSSGPAQLSLGFTFQSSCPNNVDCGAQMRLTGPRGIDYVTAHILNGTICLETTQSTCASHVAYGSYAPNTAYRINLLMNSGPSATDYMTVCTDGPGGTVLGTTTNASFTSADEINTIFEGISGEEPTTSGYHYYWRNVVVNAPYSATSCF